MSWLWAPWTWSFKFWLCSEKSIKMRQICICFVCWFLCLCVYIRGSRFSIDPTSDQEMIFRINPDTGAITLGKILDRETAGWHNITVKAVEAGTPSSKHKWFMAARCSNKRIRDIVHAQSELRSVVSGDILYSCQYIFFLFFLLSCSHCYRVKTWKTCESNAAHQRNEQTF